MVRALIHLHIAGLLDTDVYAHRHTHTYSSFLLRCSTSLRRGLKNFLTEEKYCDDDEEEVDDDDMKLYIGL